MPAKLPMKSIQGVGCTPKTFAATTPRPISMIATEMPASTETIEAIRISAARIVAVAKSVTGLLPKESNLRADV
jgi:hypothetical protein